MENYYAKKLSAERLLKVYEIATPRIQQYLEAEIKYVLDKVQPSDAVIELGCGYGRVLVRLAEKSNRVAGIDISKDNIEYAQEFLAGNHRVDLYQMDAGELKFEDGSFDVVVVIQNGISAFKVAPEKMIKECLRIAKKGGLVLFSTYSEKIWNERMEWFKLQADYGLLGEIDWEATGNGEIVCKDGFRATTFSPDDFISLMEKLNIVFKIVEVDESSLFCEVYPT